MTLFNVSSVQAGQLKDEYELKRKCGQEAQEYYSSSHEMVARNDENGINISDYTCHYNKKNNACYISVRDKLISKNDGTSVSRYLVDVHENKEIAMIVYHTKDKLLFACSVNDITCYSEKEYDKKIKPYMSQ
jgi:hypothetical protein